MRFRTRAMMIDAVQLRWDTWSEMCDHAGVGRLTEGKPEGVILEDERIGMHVPTPTGLMLAVEGDWVVRGAQGWLSLYKPDTFEQIYEPVPE